MKTKNILNLNKSELNELFLDMLYLKIAELQEITSERSNDHSSVITSNTSERSKDHSKVLAELCNIYNIPYHIYYIYDNRIMKSSYVEPKLNLIKKIKQYIKSKQED